MGNNKWYHPLSSHTVFANWRCHSKIELAMRVLEIPRSELIAPPDHQCDEASTPEVFGALKEYFQGDASTFAAAHFSAAHDLGRWANLDAEQIITPLVVINAFDVYSILSKISDRQAITGQQAFGVMLSEFEGKIQSAQTLVDRMGLRDSTCC